MSDPSFASLSVRSGAGGGVFVTTQWTAVLAAGRSTTTAAQTALSHLCESYWFPLYAYVRRRGYSVEDAQDLTQEFFARLLAHGWIGDADPAKGRFRTFLLTAMSRFLANEWDRTRTQKRGAGQLPLRLDTEMAEGRYQSDALTAVDRTPDRLYDLHWGLTLLERALARLGEEQQLIGKTAEFKVLRPVLTAERGAVPFATLARELGSTESAARMAAHRLRKRFRELFREEIAQTVANPDEVDTEIRHLLAAMAG